MTDLIRGAGVANLLWRSSMTSRFCSANCLSAVGDFDCDWQSEYGADDILGTRGSGNNDVVKLGVLHHRQKYLFGFPLGQRGERPVLRQDLVFFQLPGALEEPPGGLSVHVVQDVLYH